MGSESKGADGKTPCSRQPEKCDSHKQGELANSEGLALVCLVSRSPPRLPSYLSYLSTMLACLQQLWVAERFLRRGADVALLASADGETVHYHYGPKDLVTVLFYIFIAIILHAVVQEYILDKISKRLHLSKVKHSKFNESGQLVVFHLSSVIWCFYVVVTEGYLTNPRSLWEDYPHVYLPFQVKFFYLCQLAYWLHALPELYFQKVRKEEIPRQLQYICLYLVHIAGAYLLNLSRLGLVLLLLQYSTEFLFHTARLCHFADENNEKLFNAWAAVFGVTRLFILTLAVLAIGFGLARMENQAFDPEKGNFNTLLCRLCVLLLVCAAQAWLMWRFIHSQLRHWREYWSEQSAKRRVPAAPRLAARLTKRESGYHENGVVKAENGTSTRTKKLKSP
ncbi:translocating chain-associated membrane protein 2 isoform X2 [Bubalus bubalis]|uniref:translocating chain-associated membrane protein 2 isoform X2 n=1 Tax=Bubalus bubalis TaxID=89462 RepID=UPI001D115188|nr:translocating chain-associated membrane protein 2 isoform X2 [Bubalus bubalis]